MDRSGFTGWKRSVTWVRSLGGLLALTLAAPSIAIEAPFPKDISSKGLALSLAKFQDVKALQDEAIAPPPTPSQPLAEAIAPPTSPPEIPTPKAWESALSVETATPSDAPTTPSTEAETPAADLDAATRRALLIEGDRLWLAGRYDEAERQYRKAKNPGVPILAVEAVTPFSDPAALSPEGRVYWREAQEGQERDQAIRMMVGLELLVSTQPEFIPGQIRYAEALIEQERPDEAVSAIERAAEQFGDNPDLTRARVVTLAQTGHLLEASIAARQFAMLYPENPQAAELGTLAEEYLDEFQDDLREEMTLNAIASTLTSALSFVLTGNLYGPLSTLQTNLILLEGEDGMGEAFSNRAADQLPLVEDELVVNYVNDIGQRLARMTGRDEFEYEFFVVNNEELNAFALPGGKIFIFSGAILQSNSEAELAGLLAHELAHTVLSHGFQLMLESTLAGNTIQLLPYGGIIADLSLLRYSRDMERQADAFGTRLIASSGYAADGLHNLMQTLGEENPDIFLEWLSTHPDTSERLRNMSEQIEHNGYSIYAYEGIERHEQVQQRLREILNQPEDPKPAN